MDPPSIGTKLSLLAKQPRLDQNFDWVKKDNKSKEMINVDNVLEVIWLR